MAEVVDLTKKRRKHRRVIVSVTYGGYQFRETNQHIIAKEGDCGIPEDTGLLIIKTDDGERYSYPLSSLWYWSERDHPEDDDIA